MRVVVFGGSGFIGSHTADALTEAGHKVTIFDTKESQYLKKNQKMMVGNILNKEDVTKALAFKDVAYNFAALADLDESVHKPLETIEKNIIGNAIILEGCRNAKIYRFVFASTIYVYSNTGSFYRISKFASEMIIQNYYKEYKLPYTILRYGSLYGPRCQKNNFIYKILKQALEEKKITRIGDGEEIREYIHVKDAAKCSADILSDEFKNQNVNITGNQPLKIKDLLTMINEMLGGDIELKYLPEDNVPHHYKMTPYCFNPTPQGAMNLTSNYYRDFGQGILECLNNIVEAR